MYIVAVLLIRGAANEYSQIGVCLQDYCWGQSTLGPFLSLLEPVQLHCMDELFLLLSGSINVRSLSFLVVVALCYRPSYSVSFLC